MTEQFNEEKHLNMTEEEFFRTYKKVKLEYFDGYIKELEAALYFPYMKGIHLQFYINKKVKITLYKHE